MSYNLLIILLCHPIMQGDLQEKKDLREDLQKLLEKHAKEVTDMERKHKEDYEALTEKLKQKQITKEKKKELISKQKTLKVAVCRRDCVHILCTTIFTPRTIAVPPKMAGKAQERS